MCEKVYSELVSLSLKSFLLCFVDRKDEQVTEYGLGGTIICCVS